MRLLPESLRLISFSPKFLSRTWRRSSKLIAAYLWNLQKSRTLALSRRFSLSPLSEWDPARKLRGRARFAKKGTSKCMSKHSLQSDPSMLRFYLASTLTDVDGSTRSCSFRAFEFGRYAAWIATDEPFTCNYRWCGRLLSITARIRPPRSRDRLILSRGWSARSYPN